MYHEFDSRTVHFTTRYSTANHLVTISWVRIPKRTSYLKLWQLVVIFANLTQLGECHPYKLEVGSSNLSIGIYGVLDKWLKSQDSQSCIQGFESLVPYCGYRIMASSADCGSAHEGSIPSSHILWMVRQVVKSQSFQGCIMGSIPIPSARNVEDVSQAIKKANIFKNFFIKFLLNLVENCFF